MPFHPSALDVATLKDLAKNLRRGAAEVLPQASLSLSQSQELLARALNHPNWHEALQKAKAAPAKPSAVSAGHPLDNIPDRIFFFESLARALEFNASLPAALLRMKEASLAWDDDVFASYLETFPTLSSRPDQAVLLKFVLGEVGHFSKRDAIFASMSVDGGLAEACRRAAKTAEREGDRLDYAKLRRDPAPKPGA